MRCTPREPPSKQKLLYTVRLTYFNNVEKIITYVFKFGIEDIFFLILNVINSVQNLDSYGPYFIWVGICTKSLKRVASQIETSSDSST